MQNLRDLKIWVRLVVGISAILVVAGAGLVTWTTFKQRRLAIQSMEAGVLRVEGGAALAQQAGEAMVRIKAGVGQMVVAVNEIASSLKEQAHSNGENAHKVERIARLSDENSTAFQETAKTIQYIDELAHNVGQLVGRFKT